MSTEDGTRKRRVFHWKEEAEKLVNGYRDGLKNGTSQKSAASLVSKLVLTTGNPRDACLRFIRQHRIGQKRRYCLWTKPEQQRLVDLLETCTIEEVAKTLQRTQGSVRSMLQRLGESAQRGRDWFTIYSLAEALHVRADEIQKWVNNGWLKCRVVETTGIKKRIIDPDDFCSFVKQHGPTVIGHRLSFEGLKFVQTFVFPPKHAHLLPLRKPQDRTEPEEDAGELEDSA
jgi:hypothetical protein